MCWITSSELVSLADINWHVSRCIYVFKGVYGGYGADNRNLGGGSLQELCLEKSLRDSV